MKEIINTEKAAPAIGPYSQAVKVNGFVFTSGQIPFTAAGELVSEDVQEQTRQCLNNITAILEKAGTDMSKVIKCTIFIKDMNDFPKINEIYGSFFSEPYPVRSCVEVARLPKDVKVEIEAIALA